MLHAAMIDRVPSFLADGGADAALLLVCIIEDGLMMYSVLVLALQAATDNGDMPSHFPVEVVGGVCSSHDVVHLGLVVIADAGHCLELLAMLLLMKECTSLIAALACREHLLIALNRLPEKLDFQIVSPVLNGARVDLEDQSIFHNEAVIQCSLMIHNANRHCSVTMMMAPSLQMLPVGYALVLLQLGYDDEEAKVVVKIVALVDQAILYIDDLLQLCWDCCSWTS